MFLVKYPLQLQSLCDVALKLAMNAIVLTAENDPALKFKEHVHLRLHGSFTGDAFVSAPSSVHAERYVALECTVIRASVPKMIEWCHEVECVKCQHRFTVWVDLQQAGNRFHEIRVCPSRTGKACASKSFMVVEGTRIFKDYQEVKIQERARALELGSVPKSTAVVLTDDLVDKCQPGDDVIVHGVVRRRWPGGKDERSVLYSVEVRCGV